MAGWTLQNIQNQVQLLTGNDGITEFVTAWANRVLMEISTKAFWNRQIVLRNVGGGTTTGTAVETHFVSLTQAAAMTTATLAGDLIAIHRMVWHSTAELIPFSLRDLYAQLYGVVVNTSGGSSFDKYAVARWETYATVNMVPDVVFWPHVTSATTAISCYGLEAPKVMSEVTDTCWPLEFYPQVVLAGVMRYASLYLGDSTSYLLWKGKYENGVHDILQSEERRPVGTPTRRAIYPESMFQGNG
jgi:hypothetical protein